VALRILVSACLSEAAREALTHAGFDIVASGRADLAVVTLDELPSAHADRTVVLADAGDVMAAFDAGADDVVSRRIAPAELVARVDAILRRR
jgi:DNA-binding NarL/FixJ family response regulator